MTGLANGRIHTLGPVVAVVATLVGRDGRTCAEARIEDIAPVLTMVGGAGVHRRGEVVP